MSDQLLPVPKDWAAKAYVDAAKYQAMYKASVDDPVGFWGEHGKRVDWIKPYTQVKDVDYTGDVRIRWYYDGVLNVSINGKAGVAQWQSDRLDASKSVGSSAPLRTARRTSSTPSSST